MKKLNVSLLIALVLVGISATTYAANSYSIPANHTSFVQIDEHGICREVANWNANNLFVPTKTALEWTQFISNVSPAIADIRACSVASVPGCTNPAATNYNPSATVDDGSCIVPVPGCTNPAASNYNPSATVDDGSCIVPVPGCTNPAATNYNPAATVDDGSCIVPVPGCTNPAATNYNPAATVDNGSCTFPVPGCTNPAATNYNPAATVDNGSCTFPVLGCTDPAATNYNPSATVNDGSCTYGPAVVCDPWSGWSGPGGACIEAQAWQSCTFVRDATVEMWRNYGGATEARPFGPGASGFLPGECSYYTSGGFPQASCYHEHLEFHTTGYTFGLTQDSFNGCGYYQDYGYSEGYTEI